MNKLSNFNNTFCRQLKILQLQFKYLKYFVKFTQCNNVAEQNRNNWKKQTEFTDVQTTHWHDSKYILLNLFFFQCPGLQHVAVNFPSKWSMEYFYTQGTGIYFQKIKKKNTVVRWLYFYRERCIHISRYIHFSGML